VLWHKGCVHPACLTQAANGSRERAGAGHTTSFAQTPTSATTYRVCPALRPTLIYMVYGTKVSSITVVVMSAWEY